MKKFECPSLKEEEMHIDGQTAIETFFPEVKFNVNLEAAPCDYHCTRCTQKCD